MDEQKKKYRKGDGFDAWWEDRTLPQKILVGTGFCIMGIGFLALVGFAVMLLWNWLMPDIFKLEKINYWQAWGLLILCTILFKGMHFHDDNHKTDKKRRRKLRSYIKQSQTPDGDTPADSLQQS